MRPSPLQIVKPDPSLAEKIDRYGEVDRQVQQFAPVLAEHKTLKAEIESRFEHEPPEKPIASEGKLYTLQLTACSNERTITAPKKCFDLLRKLLGMDAVMALITIPLGAAVDKFLPKASHKLFLVEERTGSRKLTVVAKASPAAPPDKAA